MHELIFQLKNQQEINFSNILEQIQVADLETIFDGVNNCKLVDDKNNAKIFLSYRKIVVLLHSILWKNNKI